MTFWIFNQGLIYGQCIEIMSGCTSNWTSTAHVSEEFREERPHGLSTIRLFSSSPERSVIGDHSNPPLLW